MSVRCDDVDDLTAEAAAELEKDFGRLLGPAVMPRPLARVPPPREMTEKEMEDYIKHHKLVMFLPLDSALA